MNWADMRKTTANSLVGLAGVAGQLANASVVHGQGALWLAFGIAAAQAVSHILVTYTVPNGATTSQRLAALEKAALPAAETAAVAAEKVLPHNSIVADVEKVLHVGTPAVAPAAPAAPAASAAAELNTLVNGGNSGS